MARRRDLLAVSILKILTCFLAAVIQLQTAVADEIEIPTEIKDVLVENAKRLDPVNIFFTWQRKPSTGSEEELLTRMGTPANPTPFFYLKHGTTRWKGGKFFFQIDSLHTILPSTFSVVTNERSFDGQNYYMGVQYKEKSRNRLTTGTIADETRQERINGVRLSTNCFEPFGYLTPEGKDELLKSQLTSAVISQRGNAVVHSVSDELIDGEKHVRIQVRRDNPEHENYSDKWLPPSQMTDEIREKLAVTPFRRNYVYYLDPKRRFAVRRREEWYDNGKLLRRCECTDFQFFEERNLWLPRTCETTEYTFFLKVYSEPLFIQHLKIAAFDLQPSPDEEFVLGKGYEVQ